MMRAIVAVAVAIALAGANSATAEEVKYTVAPVIAGGALKAIAIEMELAGEPDGETEIQLPDAWSGKTDLIRGISEFRVSGGTVSAAAGDPPWRKRVRHAPNATLSIRYLVTQYWTGEPAANGQNEYRPIIRPGYFHLIGPTAFAKPNWSLATAITVKWKDVPRGWGFASNLDEAGRPLNLADLMQSVSVGGDFRVLRSGKLRVAIRGVWPFSDDAFVKRIEPIVASHYKFWGDAREPFLVTVLPLQYQPGTTSLGGTALEQAFAFFASPNVDDKQLTRTLAHEHLHNWIPRRIGSMPQTDDTKDYWLSEGFTDFFTYRLLVRDGAMTVEEAAKTFGDVLWTYGFSSARNAPNTQVVQSFWSDAEVQSLPYRRGFLFAALADFRVRMASGGSKDLDDVMMGMKQDAARLGGDIAPLARLLFLENMKKLGVDVTTDVTRFVENGESIALPAEVWQPCGGVATSEVAAFERGFDGRRTIANGNVVAGADPAGPAYAAGLRDGMRLLRLDLGEGGDSRVPLTYRVAEAGKVREISYLPAGKRRVSVQEFRLNGALDAAARTACASRLAGID
ncbi:MAG: hypothetical protein K8S25_11925 [Alphaproteobacteria bacterium]|nr:hypothetical protein [Alphaproteobacteria bacterium]